MTPFHRRQVLVAGLSLLAGLGALVWTVGLTRLEIRAFGGPAQVDYSLRIQLGILATFLGLAIPFAVARTLRRHLPRAVRLSLGLPLVAAATAYCALIPAGVVWLVSQLPP